MMTAWGGFPKRKTKIVKTRTRQKESAQHSNIGNDLSFIVDKLESSGEYFQTFYYLQDRHFQNPLSRDYKKGLWPNRFDMKMTAYVKQLTSLTCQIKEKLSAIPEEEVKHLELLPRIQVLDIKHYLWMFSLGLITEKENVKMMKTASAKVSTIPSLVSQAKSIHEKIKRGAQTAKEEVDKTIPVLRLWEPITDDNFDHIDDMFGFLDKILYINSISPQIQPQFYFSDLPGDKLMALFSKDPRLPRFELRMVEVIRRKDFDPQLKVSGFIEVAACPESLGCPKPQSRFYESLNTFLDIRRLYPKNCYCFASNSVQIHVKLDFTTREVDSILRVRSLHVNWKYNGGMVKVDVYQNEVERDDEKDDDLGFRLFKDDVEKDDDLERYYDNDKIYELPSLYDDVSEDDEDEVVFKKEKVENDTFEICNSIELSETAKKPYGGYGSHILFDKCVFLELYYVALKYTVDATLEVELVTCKEEKVLATVCAKYGEFDYGMNEGPFCEHILQPDIFVKPGKLNLMQSVFAVPARYCLRIYAILYLTSGTEILRGVHEFHVPLNGNSSFAYMEGSDCGLKLKMDWKLPHNMLRYCYR